MIEVIHSLEMALKATMKMTMFERYRVTEAYHLLLGNPLAPPR